MLEALRSSQTSFQREVVIRSSLRPFTRRGCEISEFQIRISTWKYQSIMGQLGAPLYNSSCFSSVSCGRMARLQRSNSCGISSFQDRLLAMEMGRTRREWIVKFLDWPQLIISHTKPSLPKQEPPNASRLKAFFHLKAHDGVMAVVVILWSVLKLRSKTLDTCLLAGQHSSKNLWQEIPPPSF